MITEKPCITQEQLNDMIKEHEIWQNRISMANKEIISILKDLDSKHSFISIQVISLGE